MSLGYWLRRNDALYATQRSPYQLERLVNTLKRRGTNSKNREYFVPQFYCTDEFKSKNIPVEEDVDNQVVQELASNVDFTNKEVDQQTKELNKALKKAKLGKTLADTKLVGERLDQRKKQLYYQWSQKFFECFTQHFGKLKNVIIELHLNEEQVNKFNQTLDSCLNNMQLDLNSIWQDFRQQKEQQNE